MRKKHMAEQFGLPIEPAVRVSVTLALEGDVARLWRAYSAHNAGLTPSNAQLVQSLLGIGLATWDRTMRPQRP
jgi:hypothetical protein